MKIPDLHQFLQSQDDFVLTTHENPDGDGLGSMIALGHYLRSMEDNFDRNPYCEACMIPMNRIWTANPIHFKGKGWGGSK